MCNAQSKLPPHEFKELNEWIDSLNELCEQEKSRKLAEAVDKRLKGYPLQYITGKAYFRYLTIPIQTGIFIPRPESEILTQLVLDDIKTQVELDKSVTKCARLNKCYNIADICAGSGAIGISLAAELSRIFTGTRVSFNICLIEKHENTHLPNFTKQLIKQGVIDCNIVSISVFYFDIMQAKLSDFAAVLGKRNYIAAKSHNSLVLQTPVKDELTTNKTSSNDLSLNTHALNQPISFSPFDFIVSNPPYIPVELKQQTLANATELTHEPLDALFAQKNGLEVINQIIDLSSGNFTSAVPNIPKQINRHNGATWLKPGGNLYLEHYHTQGELISQKMKKQNFTKVVTINDLNNRPVFTKGQFHRSALSK